MKSNGRSIPRTRAWRTFSSREGTGIDRHVRAGAVPRCPRCAEVLEAQPETRLSPCLVLDATAYDLACRACRRFWCVVRHTPRSLRLLRMRRFAAAVRAVRPDPIRSWNTGTPVMPRNLAV